MKVVFITSNHYLDTAVPLINALLKYIEVTVIVCCLEKHREFFFSPSLSYPSKASLIEVANNKIKYLPGYAGLLKQGEKKLNLVFVFYKNYKMLSLTAWGNIRKVRKYLAKADYLHIQSLNIHNYFIVNKMPYRKLIIDIHDVLEHSGQNLSAWSKFIHRKWLRLANEIIIHNFNDRQYIANRLVSLKNKINVLPFGLVYLTDKQIEFACSDRPTLLFFGRICKYKGIEYLIEAVSIIKKEVSDLKVIIAGKGTYDFGKSKIQKDETYEFIDHYIPNSQLATLIEKSTLVICPYTDATQSGVIMTAFSFNKPVVATSVGGIPEVIEDGVTGLLVPPKDPYKLAQAIIYLLRDQNKRNKMSENIKMKFSQENFSWDYIARKTIEVYKKENNG